MQLSVVTSLYMSAPHLVEFHRRVSAVAEAVTTDFEILFVNDGSPDDSLEIAVGLQRRDSRVTVIDLSRNFGHHRALMTGLRHAKGDIVFLVDCDLEEKPEWLADFRVAMVEAGADVVCGTQRIRRGGVARRIGGWLFYVMDRILSEDPMPTGVTVASLMTRGYVAALTTHGEREFEIGGLRMLTGFRQATVPVDKDFRGVSSYTFGRRMALAVRNTVAFSRRPLVVVVGLGVAITCGVGMAAVAVGLGWRFPEGSTWILLSVWLATGLMVLCIGLTGLYVGQVLVEVKARPYTIVRRIYRAG